MKIAVVSCANGLGHLKRLVRILNQLVDRGFVESVTLFCDVSGLQRISGWREYLRLQEWCTVKIVNVSLPVIWKLNQEDYGEWLLDWHTTIPSWRLQDFDYVLSDNLVEPLLYSDRVTLSGSFFWHDVLASSFPGSKVIEKYASFCKDMLESSQPHVIANHYFITPAVLEQTNVHQVGLVPFCEAKQTGRTNKLPRRVLIALGGAQAANGVTEMLAGAVNRMCSGGMEVFAAEAIFQTLQTRCPEIQSRSFSDDSLETIDLAVIRGGLGTISDCIASRVPMLYIDDPSPEIQHNQARLNEMGIGLPFDRFLQDTAEILTNPFVYKRTLSKMTGFDLRGHLEATDILARLWDAPQQQAVTCFT